MDAAEQSAQQQRRLYLINGLGITAVVLALAIGAMLFVLQGNVPEYRGAVIDPPRPSPAFALRDQYGDPVQWADYRGRTVVLSFLYTNCRDLCPVIAAKLLRTRAALGDTVDDVAFVAISVDPQRDTPQAIAEFFAKWNIEEPWDYLVGSEAELHPLWEHYWVGELREEAIADNPLVAERAFGDYAVDHTSPVHLIDSDGFGRVAYSSLFTPDELANDILIVAR